MGANVPIYFNQGGQTLVVDTGGTLDTTNGTVTLGPVAVGVDGIETANLQDDCVTTDKIDDEAVTTAKLGLLAVDTGQLADAAVTAAKLDADAVVTASIVDQNVTYAKQLLYFSSMDITQGAMPEVIPHMLGVSPSAVLVVPVDTTDMTIASDGFATSYTADATNITVTATENLVYRVMAWG